MMLAILLWVVAGFIVFGAISNILIIGKPRQPQTHKGAVAVIVLSGFWVAVIVMAALAVS